MFSCRGCGSDLSHEDVVADLGSMPLANGLLTQDNLYQPETHYPLLLLVCGRCLLVQLPSLIDPQTLFTDAYPFRSGASATWLGHCKQFADDAVERFKLGPLSNVLEIGSNDGMGLVRFRHHGIPAHGVEPCQDAAREALNHGIATAIGWWGSEYARGLKKSGYKADLVIGRNVLAHVPDLQDFLYGVRTVLAPGGTAVFEVPYVKNMVQYQQWDQIYHEHHCYFSVTSLMDAFSLCGLHINDVEHIPVHGGSIRVYATLTIDENHKPHSLAVANALADEADEGLQNPETYKSLALALRADKRNTLNLLSNLEGLVVGYGASAKAATYLNYCGIGPEMIEYIVDTTPAKWGFYTPGSHIPIKPPKHLNGNIGAVVNFCWNWPEESTARIRSATDAPIVTLRKTPVPV